MSGLSLLRATLLLCFCVYALGSPLLARAEEARPLRYNTRVEPALTLALGAAWITSEVLKDKLAPSSCRWCDDNGLDRGVRSALRWDNTNTAAKTSDFLAFGGLPVVALSGLSGLALMDGHSPQILADLGIVLEAVVIAADLNQIVKFSVGRERPFVHALSADEKPRTRHPSDNHLSFYSGHTSPAFTIAVSSAMVATLRGRRFAPLLWGTLLPLAATTAYLRIAADKHYFTDVLVGAAVGSAIGVLIPLLHRMPSEQPVMVNATGSSLSLTWRR